MLFIIMLELNQYLKQYKYKPNVNSISDKRLFQGLLPLHLLSGFYCQFNLSTFVIKFLLHTIAISATHFPNFFYIPLLLHLSKKIYAFWRNTKRTFTLNFQIKNLYVLISSGDSQFVHFYSISMDREVQAPSYNSDIL